MKIDPDTLPEAGEQKTGDAPPSSRALVPQRPGDPPFRNLLAIPEGAPGYLAEAKREIQISALRRLEALDQVYRELVAQAQRIVVDARRDLLLHDLPVQAAKIRGLTYHLYERDGRDAPRRFFSILAPEEHAQADPLARHLASYRLNEDNSWTRLDGGTGEPWLLAQAG
jgi:hypothetical protein